MEEQTIINIILLGLTLTMAWIVVNLLQHIYSLNKTVSALLDLSEIEHKRLNDQGEAISTLTVLLRIPEKYKLYKEQQEKANRYNDDN